MIGDTCPSINTVRVAQTGNRSHSLFVPHTQRPVHELCLNGMRYASEWDFLLMASYWPVLGFDVGHVVQMTVYRALLVRLDGSRKNIGRVQRAWKRTFYGITQSPLLPDVPGWKLAAGKFSLHDVIYKYRATRRFAPICTQRPSATRE